MSQKRAKLGTVVTRTRTIVLCSIAAFAAGAVTTKAAETDESPACYDAIVSATAVKQIPSEIPDCGPECIIMRWPWFVDLKVERVLKGRVPSRTLSAQAVLHTDFVKRPFIWSLRRNKAGGFNAQLNPDKNVVRCASNAEPAEPYLRPGEGQTLEELRRAGERIYNRH